MFNPVPVLEDHAVLIKPLCYEDIEPLYEVACDPLLWEHHPLNEACKKAVFDLFFEDAIQAGSLLITDTLRNKVIGCTRFYNYNGQESSVVIGHTFIARDYWGTGYNTRIKKLMLGYAFRHVRKVLFYVVTGNIRSRRALEKIGAQAVQPIVRSYNGKLMHCLIYEIEQGQMNFESLPQ